MKHNCIAYTLKIVPTQRDGYVFVYTGVNDWLYSCKGLIGNGPGLIKWDLSSLERCTLLNNHQTLVPNDIRCSNRKVAEETRNDDSSPEEVQ